MIIDHTVTLRYVSFVHLSPKYKKEGESPSFCLYSGIKLTF